MHQILLVDDEKKELTVRYSPVGFVDGGLALSSPKTRKVYYEKDVRPFDSIKRGDWVSLHWNLASEVLSHAQARNLNRFTAADIASTNELLRQLHKAR